MEASISAERNRTESQVEENTDDSPCTYVTKDGCTFYEGKKFGDFSLKIVGEVHDSSRKGLTSGEGKWLVSTTGFVFSTQYTRVLTLTCSAFDGKRHLLDSLRAKFPGGSINLESHVTNVMVGTYWQSLLADYRNVFNAESQSSRVAYTTTHLGHQKIPNCDNYWFLDSHLHIEDNCLLMEDSYKVFDISNRDALFPFSTTINFSLLNLDRLLDATKRLVNMSSYFDVNAEQFKLSLSFVATRLLRSYKVEETWGESNLGLIFSKEKNCGKSLTLRLIAKLQGISNSHHPLLLSGGNQNTAGTSGKKVMETLCNSSLVALVDDPLLSQHLGEFLNQGQSGLAQGSAKSGLLYPRGSLLMTSNSKEVQRIQGRVIRFDYLLNPEHRDHDEVQLTMFADDNKGLLLAWCMRFLPLYEEISEELNEDLKLIVKRCLPNHQMRWIRGITYNFLTYAMIHASAEESPNLIKAIEKLMQSNISVNTERSVMERLQVEIFLLMCKNMKDNISSLTWLNPLLKVQVSAGNDRREKAVSVKTAVIGNMGNVSWTEVKQEIQALTFNGGDQRSVCFAKDNKATLADVRAKRNTALITTGQAYKIPQHALDPLFIQWVNYVTGIENQGKPELDYLDGRNDFEKDVNEMEGKLEEEDREKVRIIEEVIKIKIKEYCDNIGYGHGSAEAGKGCQPKASKQDYTKFLSPRSKEFYNKFTPNKKRAFEMGVKAEQKFQVSKTQSVAESEPGRSPLNLDNTRTPQAAGNYEGTFGTVRNTQEILSTPSALKRRLTFAEGAFGVVSGERQGEEASTCDLGNKEQNEQDHSSKGNKKKKANKNKCPCKRDLKSRKLKWVACDDCNQWFHLNCSGLEELPEEEELWNCPNCYIANSTSG